MMRRILPLLALTAAALASPVLAQEAGTGDPSAGLLTQGLDIEGTAPVRCSIQPIALAPGSFGALQPAGQGSAVVRLGSPDFVDPTTAVPVGGELGLSVPIICNGAHVLHVRSSNGRLTLESGAAAGGGFANSLDYGLTASWAGESQSFNTTGASSLEIPVGQASSGDALVTIVVPSGGSPLVAGTYSDLIVVEVTVGS